jgi:hypothetical protein
LVTLVASIASTKINVQSSNVDFLLRRQEGAGAISDIQISPQCGNYFVNEERVHSCQN